MLPIHLEPQNANNKSLTTNCLHYISNHKMLTLYLITGLQNANNRIPLNRARR